MLDKSSLLGFEHVLPFSFQVGNFHEFITIVSFVIALFCPIDNQNNAILDIFEVLKWMKEFSYQLG